MALVQEVAAYMRRSAAGGSFVDLDCIPIGRYIQSVGPAGVHTMHIKFHETFDVPIGLAFNCFATPKDWGRLFGFAGEVVDRGYGWYAVPLRRFPVPLVTRVDVLVPERRVHWVFKGFWRGEGEVNFETAGNGVSIWGFEDIAIPRMLGLGPMFEQRYLQRPFERLWESGWRRLRKNNTRKTPFAHRDE